MTLRSSAVPVAVRWRWLAAVLVLVGAQNVVVRADQA